MEDQRTPANQPPEGDAATLRRALAAIRDLQGRLDAAEARRSEPVAIIGMACRFPGGATTPEAFWELLRSGTDATTEVPLERWDAEAIYDPDPDAPGKTYVRRGGFLLEPVDRFDAAFFSISPREASAMDPVHRMLLELSWEALERAGIPPLSLEGTETGTFVGLSGSDYGILQSRRPLDEIDPYRGNGTAPCIGGGRISHFLGLQGPNFTLDTACSSGLVALAQGVESLRARRCNLALAGSSHLMLSPEGTIFLCRMRALSPDGRCRTYDRSASGYGRGEGGAMFVLKRLQDARTDGDPVLGVVRGIAVNHDGRSAGLTVPNPAAQRAVISAALRDAGLQPGSLDYVETHGTATPLGDPIELRALAEVLGRDRPEDRPLLLGSVKTNIGHTEPVAGLAGLMKLVLALGHRAIPPHLHFESPTPHADWGRMPFRVSTESVTWPETGSPPTGGVSAFGFSGTNAHVIVEAPPPLPEDPLPAASQRPIQLLPLSAKTPEALRDLATRVVETLENDPPLEDLCAVASRGRSHFDTRVAVTGESPREMAERLGEYLSGGTPPGIHGGGPSKAAPLSVAFLFTGQGSQYPGMGRALYETEPIVRKVLDACDEASRDLHEHPVLPILLGSDPTSSQLLDRTVYTQPALFALEVALARLWQSWGILPAAVMGHSVGEYAAACVAGVFDLEAGMRLMSERGRLMQALPPGGAMAAIFADEASVEGELRNTSGTAVIAAVNGPENTVISGTREGVDEVVDRFIARGVESQSLSVSHAFHSPLLDPFLDSFREVAGRVHYRDPEIPVVGNLGGAFVKPGEMTHEEYWVRHAREPVRFAAGVDRLIESGVDAFIEIGPHPTLLGMARRCAPESEALWLPTLRRNRPEWSQIFESLGELYGRGAEIDWRGVCRTPPRRSDALPTYPFQRKPYWFRERSDVGVAGDTPVNILFGADAKARHPLLGTRIHSPAMDGWVFQRALSAEPPPYLADHRVLNRLVVPGAVFVEMGLAAAIAGPGWFDASLQDVALIQPLVLLEEEPIICQVIVGKPDGRKEEAPVRIVSAQVRRDGEVIWITHATATLSNESAPTASPAIELDQLRRIVSDPEDLAALRAFMEAHGITHGPAFQAIEEAWVGEGQVLGRVRVPEDATHTYRLHPIVLDCAIQLLGASTRLTSSEGGGVVVLAGIKEVILREPMGSEVWAHVSIAEVADGEFGAIEADLTLFNADGGVTARILGFQAREVTSADIQVPGTLDQDLDTYQLAWEPAPDLEPVGTLEGGRWLIIGNEEDRLGQGLIAELISRGEAVVSLPLDTVDWGNGLSRAFGNPNTPNSDARRVVFIASASDHEEAVTERAIDVAGNVHELVRTLVSEPWRQVQLFLLTEGATPVEGLPGRSGLAGAPLWGMVSAIRAEHPELESRVIDLDGDAPELDLLLDELTNESSEPMIAHRGGSRRRVRLKPRGAIEASVSRRQLPSHGAFQIEVTQRGTLDGLSYVAADRVEPADHEVEVEVEATGLNFRDVLNVLGMYPGDPGLPGTEFAGRIARVGAAVEGLVPGDRVMGVGTGAFASFVNVPRMSVARTPEGLDPSVAATLPIVFLTADWALREISHVQPGERVLIHAGTGGVGLAAIQLASAMGAEIHATAGSERKRSFLRSIGVPYVYDSRDPAFADEVRECTDGRGVDVVINSLTGDMLRRSLQLLGPGGRFVELGKAELLESMQVERDHPGVQYVPFDLTDVIHATPELFQGLLEQLVERVKIGELRPLPCRTFPADAILDAFRFMAQARHIGKISIGSAARDRPTIREDGAYFVSGGTGGIGAKLARWLIEEGAGLVLINGRSRPSDDLLDWIELANTPSPRIEFVQGDISDSGFADRLVDLFGALDLPLRGVFHAAGILDDGLILDYDRGRLEAVMAAKVRGTWTLHEATSDLDLDHFVLFSSITSFLGGPGQSAYGAANAFLGTFAGWRRSVGLPALTIDWCGWEGEGMVASLGDSERKRLVSSGLPLLSAARAFDRLGQLLESDEHRVAVVQFDGEILGRLVRLPPVLSHVVRTAPTPEAAQSGPRLDLEALRDAEPEERRRRVVAYLLPVVGRVLGIPDGQLAADIPISEVGFDSLMVLEVRNRIEFELGLRIPMSDLVSGPSSLELAETIAELLAVDEERPALEHEPARIEGEI